MSNQHYFDVPFAFSGDVTAIPDPLQAGGTVSFTEGWNYNYQRNLSTDPAALPIDRSTMNWLLLQITTALQALQVGTVPEWVTAAQNGGVAISYGLGAEVLWSASGNAPFGKYVSLTAANVATPSASDPLGATTGWQVVCDPIASSAQAAAGTNNASIMTPLLVAQQTALRALLAGNATQVFNVGPATAATHAVEFGQVAGVVGQTQNLFMRITAATSSATLTADEIIVESALGGLRYCLANFNKTVNLAATGAGGMDVGSPPTSGFVALYAIYNPTTQTAALLATNAATKQSNVYGGTSMPSGYTASALVSIIAIAGSQFTIATQRGRKVTFPLINAYTGSTVPTTPTALSPAVIPANAVAIGGIIGIQSTSAGAAASLDIYGDATATGRQSIGNGSVVAGQGYTSSFTDFLLFAAPTFYFTAAVSAGTLTATVNMSSYQF